MPKVKDAPASKSRKIRFSVRLPRADEVALTGDFTQWNPEGIPLHHSGGDEWYALIELSPGEHQYRLRVDGDWQDDPEAVQKVGNPFGTQNCILRVP
jgi:1,4-alpha-glucan branching enzyme